MRRAWLSILLLVPLGCRGQFDIAQYLAEGDSGEAESSSGNESSESGVDATSTGPGDTESDTTDSMETETDTEETTSNCASNQLELGGGCFGVREIIDTDVDPTDLALADFSGDSRIDLLLAGDEYRLRLGKEGNMFEGAMALPGITGNRVAVGDVDDDGLLDIAAIGENVNLHTSLQNGGFTSNAVLPLAGIDGAFGNLDGDNDADLLVSGTTLRVLTSESGSWLLNLELGYAGESVRVADIDDDGDLDIALAQPTGNQLALFANTGNGALGSPTMFVLPQVVELELADLDGDDVPELLVLGSDSVTAYAVQSDFALMELGTHPVGQDPRGLAVAELDGDGQLDVATVNLESDDISILLSGNSGFAPELRLAMPSSTDDPTLIAAANLDDDGRAELVVAAPGTNRVFVLGLIP